MRSINALLDGYTKTAFNIKADAPRQDSPKPPTHRVGRRTLTERQRRYPLLRLAADRVKHEAETREQRYLRRLDCIHLSGSRTHQQRWEALAILIESLLSRMDLTNLCLGWLDNKGEFHLNRQRILVEDSLLTPSRVSRTLKALEQGGYLTRKYERYYSPERADWLTRTTIRLRRQFFIDLGLGHELAKVQDRKKIQHAKAMQEAINACNQRKLIEDARKQRCKESHARSQGYHRAKQQSTGLLKKVEWIAKRNATLFRLRADHPELSDAEMIKIITQQFPLYE